jgi:fumarylacetoacetate (FAA) hydrolase
MPRDAIALEVLRVKLVTYSHPATGNSPRAGVLQGDRVLDVNGLTEGKVSDTMARILEHCETTFPVIDESAQVFARDYELMAELPMHIAVPIWEVTLHTPLPSPCSFRDFYAFEQHVAAGFARRDRPVPPAWYETPIFYFGNHGSFVGPDREVPKPVETRELDFEMEIAAIVGIAGRDIAPEHGLTHIAGFALLNDWSARDIQRQEMSVGLGPAKGKDFATSLGPWLVTTDELRDVLIGGRLAIEVVVRVNGEELGRSNGTRMHWTFGDLIATASRGVDLRPGDVIATGTLPNGCLLELGTDEQPWLEPGDEVEIESSRLGRLRNRIA